MQERDIERKLVRAAKSKGGLAVKFTSPGFAGMPDRLLLLPRGKLAFVEVKAPGKTPRALQLKRHGMLRQLGFKVFILDSTEQIEAILEEVKGCTNTKNTR